MKIFNIFFAFLFYSYNLKASDELICSLNGTTIYTVNGVNNNDDDAVKIKNKIESITIESKL